MQDDSSFKLVFGDSPLIRLLDFFLDNPEFDYSLTDIARLSNISWTTLHNYWGNLLKLEVITKTRTVGMAKMYKLNKENALVKKLIDLDFFISEKYIAKELEKQKIHH